MIPTAPLAHLRFPLEQSRGRRYPELAHPYRNPFQRDRDRVVHARAFRRLENKTQVFTAGVSDHFRNGIGKRGKDLRDAWFGRVKEYSGSRSTGPATSSRTIPAAATCI